MLKVAGTAPGPKLELGNTIWFFYTSDRKQIIEPSVLPAGAGNWNHTPEPIPGTPAKEGGILNNLSTMRPNAHSLS